MILNSPTISGSLTVTGNILTSGSITLSGSVASASFAATASFVALAQSASNAVSAQTASFANTLTVAGNLTAQTLVVQTITSSVDFVTGSTRFGSVIGNTHNFTGSVSISGSLSGVGATFSNNIIAGGSTDDTSGGLYSNIALNNSTYSRYSLLTGGTARARFQFDGTNTSLTTTSTGGKLQLATFGASAMEFFTNDALKMTITSGGNVGIGTTNISTEANLHLGAQSTLEGGQLILQRGTSQVSASHLDNYQNQFRVMSGTDTTSNTVRMSVDMTNGSTIFYGSVTSPSLYGNSYSQTSASGTTSFVNTGIFYNTSLTGFFNNGTYLLAVTGNPNGAGSSEYRGVYIGYVFVATGYDFGISSVVQRISYTQLVTGDPLNIGALTISAVFWNGTTETTQQTNATTNNQIRIKISGYNSSNIGAGQVVTLTKVI